MHDIGVIVVLYNVRPQSYIKNLISYVNKNNVSYVCIVDNSDTCKDQSCKAFVGFDKVEYLRLGENRGIAYAINFGVKKCRVNNCLWVLTLDQDSYFSDNFYRTPDALARVIYFPYYDFGNGHLVEAKVQSGALIPLHLFDEIGFFREDYFIDYVDYDFFERCILNHVKMLTCESVVLYHEPGQKKQGDILVFSYSYTSISAIRYYYVFRNGIDYSLRYKKVGVLYSLLKNILKILLQEPKKKKRLYYCFLGIIDRIRNNWGNYSCIHNDRL